MGSSKLLKRGQLELKLWKPHHALFVDNFRVASWDAQDQVIHPDYDNLVKAKLTWDEIMEKVIKMKLDFARSAAR